MKIKIGMAVIAAVFSFQLSVGQRTTDANITGHVVRKGTHDHIPYITLTLKGTTVAVMTDGSGHYFLKNLPEGTYTLVASAMGYKPEEKEVTLTRNRTIEVNFEMEESSVQMDQIVVSSNRAETNRREASTIVNVMSAKLMESTGSNNLAEGLNFQPGIRVEYTCSNCGVPQLRINGLEGQYSQILVDSRPIFSSLASVYGLEQMPAGMVDRVEVIRGGGSALFGANAIGGIINIITKEPVRNSLELSNSTGLMGGKKLDMNNAFNGSFVSDDYRTGVYLFGMTRNRRPYDRNDDGFSEIPKLKSETMGFRGYYKTDAYSKLTAEYHHLHEFRRGGDNFDRPAHEADIAEQLEHYIDGGGLKYERTSVDYHHRFNVYTSAQNIRRNSYFGTEQDPDAYGNTTDITVVGGAQYAYSFDRLWFLPSDLTLGLEYNYNRLRDRMLGYDRNIEQDSKTFGGYFQNEWQNQRVSLLLGGRIDKNNLIDHVVFSPRVNARYTPVEEVGLRASYSSGYRAPQAYDEDLHVAAVGGEVALIVLDPDLKPEYSDSFSVSADLYKRFGEVQMNLLLEGFYTDLKDVFALEPGGHDEKGNLILVRANASGAVVKGINTEYQFSFADKLIVQLGYTYQKSRYKEPEAWSEDENLQPQKKMPRSPDSYGYGVVTYNGFKNISMTLNGNYTGRMLVPHFAGYVPEDTEKITARFWDIGYKFAYTIPLRGHLSVELNAGIKNMFDSFQKDVDKGIDKDAGYIYGPATPRTVFFGVKFRI